MGRGRRSSVSLPSGASIFTCPNKCTKVTLTRLLDKFQPVLLFRVKHVAGGIFLLTICLLLYFWIMLPADTIDSLYCYKDHIQNGRVICLPQCPKNHYILPGMSECQKMLTCKDIKSNQLKVIRGIGTGAVKAVFLASWNGYDVIVNTLTQQQYKEDFLHGLSMLHSSQQSHRVTQLLGYCGTVFVSEYHILGDASKLLDLLLQPQYKHLDTLSVRFGLCIDFAQIISYFHSHHSGTRVFCDSNTLSATLQQFLITSGLRLVANDLDALPRVKSDRKIICGHQAIYTNFAAPEQRWPFSSLPYDEKLLPGYDEKVDIWKIPDVCEHFLGSDSEAVKFHLFKLHSRCKSEVPEERPNATFLLSAYRRIQDELGLS